MLRNRGAKQNKLVYDLKYHPMDDSIRPTQAAKRRSAHGERLLSSDDSSECLSVHCDADTPPLSEASFEGEAFLEKRGWKQAKQGKKRSRDQMQSPQEPTRRSSRRVSDEKKSYDMSVHPQDEDLELLSSDDEELSMPSPKRKRTHSRKSGNSSAATSIAPKTKAGRAKRIVISSDAESGTMDQEGIFTGGDSLDGIFQMSPEEVAHADDTQVKPTSSTSSICTPPPHGIRRKESLDVWKLFPGDRYFRHERDSLPFTQGQSFEIWEEQTEDQAVKEALAAFPLDFEHDDKENEIEGADQQNSDPLEGISVLPASQSRRSDGDALDAQNPRLVHGALYEEEVIALDNYGLHSTDGANDEDAADQLDTNLEIMRLLASGGDLPRETSKNDPSESIP
ncbi:hypothetical protein T440DRAFT_385243 [Plenodomus tracheiphilus IPT5]|uniref:Uncharacterized protein n=1 Tax=Plenodomus tracheiphilus IPT5 TaxID=1408161 RepID=A0A6A7BK86_9PLEO|nr:hypothetical protein T440DRAFT_385243 [Plenodomus tracheiphilus IPT5]